MQEVEADCHTFRRGGFEWITDTLETKAVPTPYPWRTWTTVVERVPDGYKVISDGMHRDGTKRHMEFVWRLDGAPSPITGAEPGSTYSWKRIDDHTFETERRGADGHLVLTSRVVISPDGKLRANCTTLWGAHGQVVLSDLEVMDKR